MESEYSVPFGETWYSFHVPRGVFTCVAAFNEQPTLADPGAAIESALDNPLGAPGLGELVARVRPQKIVIAFTDATRACPDHLLVPSVLKRLEQAGVPDEAITLLCAVGLHRPSTEGEKRAKLGDWVVDRYNVIDHDARRPNGTLRVGHTPQGIPLEVNRLAYEADLLIATGIVEPHQYAGYSGGGKTITIGCGGEETIAATHGPAMLDLPGVRLGQVEGNPFQEAVRQVARQAGLSFVLNAVQDADHHILKVAAGAPGEVHDELVTFGRQAFEVSVPHQYDVVVAGVGAPKDVNLYQASRAITYLQLTATPAVRPGGILILPAPCPEGAGEGIGEQRFLAALRNAPNIAAMLKNMRANGYPPGAQRAFVVGQALEHVDVIVVGALDKQVIRDCKMMPVDIMDEAFALAIQKLGKDLSLLIVPHALQTLVRVGDCPA